MRRVSGLTYADVVREGPRRPEYPLLTDVEVDVMYYAEKRRRRKEEQSRRRHARLVTRHASKIIATHIKSDTSDHAVYPNLL